MIKFALICDSEHQFEGWFPNNEEYENQLSGGLLLCPICDTNKVQKAIMAPAIKKTKETKKNTKRNKAKIEKFKKEVLSDEMMMASQAKHVMRKIRDYVKKNFENVGDNFYDEAVKADEGERDDKFYGTPSESEIKELLEDGVDLFHVPEIKDN